MNINLVLGKLTNWISSFQKITLQVAHTFVVIKLYIAISTTSNYDKDENSYSFIDFALQLCIEKRISEICI